MSQAMWVRFLVGFATLLLVWAILWLTFVVMGVPAWTPDWAEQHLVRLPGRLGRVAAEPLLFPSTSPDV